LVLVVALSVALALSQSELAQLEQEMESVLPLRGLDVAAQVERVTAAAGVPAEVDSILYSGKTYLIRYAYFDPESGTKRGSSFKLRYEGKGEFVGVIRAAPYLKPKPDAQGERGLKITVTDPELEAVFRSP
jgi:hypothetical protein